MSFPQYPKYKDSGVDWLGAVPQGWSIGPLKHGYEVKLGKMLQVEASHPDDKLVPYLRAANVQWANINTDDIKMMWLSPSERHQLKLLIGDLLVSEGGDVGRSAIWQDEIEDCYIQNSVNRVRGKYGNLTKLLYYWMVTIKANGYVDVLCNKSTIAHFTAEKVAAVPTPFPPLSEQHAIAAFLDTETSRIDALIAEYEILIGLLKEKRQALISQAVTKGLNPDVPMKDSGVEWLEEVPEHWGKATLKQLVAGIESGVSVNATDISAEPGEIAVLKTSCVYGGHFSITENKTVAPHDISRVSCPIRAGTLIVSRMNTPKLVGESGLVRESRDHIYLPDRLWQVHFKEISTEYVYFWSRTQSYRIQVEMACDGASSSMQSFSKEDYLSFMLPLPPFSEQQAIAAFLDAETARMDSLIQDAVTAIHLLQGRRTALISDAVTGKIDVRGLQ